MIYLISIIIIVCDQLFKYLIIRNFIMGQSYPVIDNLFYLTYVKNTGAAFGMLPAYSDFFKYMSAIIVIGFFIYIHFSSIKGIFLNIGAGLIIGGAVGNLIDRIRFDGVIDYLDFQFWPVFNLADIAIVIGTVFIIIYLLRIE